MSKELEETLADAFGNSEQYDANGGIQLTQSQKEKRTRLMTKKSELIDLAAQKIQSKMASLSDVIFVYQYVLSKISSKKIDGNGKILDGSVDFSCTVGSFRSRRKTRIAISFLISDGKLCDTNQFTTTTGAAHLLNKEAMKKVLCVKEPDTAIMKYREGFMKTMQWSANYQN